MIKLAIPEVGKEELKEIEKVFDSKYLVQGKKVLEFENLIKQYLNVKNAIAVSSGTAALHLALLALDIKRGDEVIVPDFTFPATSNVVELVGARPKFVDIDASTFCIDVKKIEEQINSSTKVIMPVQEFGQSSDMDKILELAKKHNLKIVEDAACALGAQYKNKKVGTIGDIGCFSLHPRKAITTGEGGILVTNNDELAEKIRVLRNHGMQNLYGKVRFTIPGFNYRITDIQGAMGVAQLKKIDKINFKRRELVLKYNELLKNVKNLKVPNEEQYGKHIWQTYHVMLEKDVDRNKLIRNLKEKGIETNFGAYAVHLQPYYKNKYNLQDNKYKNSTYAYNQGLALPLHCKMGDKEIQKVVLELRRALNG